MRRNDSRAGLRASASGVRPPPQYRVNATHWAATWLQVQFEVAPAARRRAELDQASRAEVTTWPPVVSMRQVLCD